MKSGVAYVFNSADVSLLDINMLIDIGKRFDLVEVNEDISYEYLELDNVEEVINNNKEKKKYVL